MNNKRNKCDSCHKDKSPLYELDNKAVCERCYGEGYDNGRKPVIVGSMRISQYDDNKNDLVNKIIENRSIWGQEPVRDESIAPRVAGLMEKMTIRQKVLMSYQHGDILSKRRYGNLLQRLQRHVLVNFRDGVQSFLDNHPNTKRESWKVATIYQVAQDHGISVDQADEYIENYDGRENDEAYEIMDIMNDWYGTEDPAYNLEGVLKYGSEDSSTRDSLELVNDTIYTLKQSLEAKPNSEVEAELKRLYITQEQLKDTLSNEGNSEDYIRRLLYDLIYEASLLKQRVDVFKEAEGIMLDIREARSSGDITDQVVAYEKVLNAIHNSGPLMEYVFFPGREFHGRFRGEIKSFLDNLSNMTDTALNDSDRDYILQQASMRISQYDGATLGDLAYIQTNYPEADFWIVRKGSDKTVGSVTKEFKPQHIGIKVIATETLDPGYLYYALMNIYNQGYFRGKAIGSLNLKHIRVQDVKGIPIG